jgi:hypothetical protein
VWDTLHKVFTEATGLLTSGILLVKHGEEVLETGLRWIGLRDEVERHGERRQHMAVSLSAILKDAELAKSLAPQIEAVWTALDNLYKAYEALQSPPTA